MNLYSVKRKSVALEVALSSHQITTYYCKSLIKVHKMYDSLSEKTIKIYRKIFFKVALVTVDLLQSMR